MLSHNEFLMKRPQIIFILFRKSNFAFKFYIWWLGRLTFHIAKLSSDLKYLICLQVKNIFCYWLRDILYRWKISYAGEKYLLDHSHDQKGSLKFWCKGTFIFLQCFLYPCWPFKHISWYTTALMMKTHSFIMIGSFVGGRQANYEGAGSFIPHWLFRTKSELALLLEMENYFGNGK